MSAQALPLFHLYGDPPDDQAFDFIHVETIASRSSIHDWVIRAHRHRNLFQILLVARGGGEMTFEAAVIPFAGPCAILVPPTIAHGFRFPIRRRDRSSVQMIASNHNGSFQRARADQFIKFQAHGGAFAVSQPADPSRQPLKVHMFLRQRNPSL